MTFEEYLSQRQVLEGRLTNLDLNYQFVFRMNIDTLKSLMDIFESAYLEKSREVESLTRDIKRIIGKDAFKYIGGEKLERRFE